MKLEDIHSVYFIGIGGIGMSAIARWFHAQGIDVAGYDKTPTPLTEALQNLGMHIHFEDEVELLPEFLSKEHTQIVYTPAIPKHHKELNFLRNQGFDVLKRSEVLGIITRESFTLAVAGTHGKTTTSSMLAYLLDAAGENCTAFLGGIARNFDSNLVLGKEKEKQLIVVEADEYDRSFLRLNPDVAVLTTIDPDHLDIYGDGQTFVQSFCDFVSLLGDEGNLIFHEDITINVTQGCPKIGALRYGLGSQTDCHAENIRVSDGAQLFDYRQGEVLIQDLRLRLPGRHNIQNAVAAIAASLGVGVTPDQIKEVFDGYAGVKRRFEYIHYTENKVYIDDYAHHPTEITAFISSLKELFPGKKITVVFQPHLFSRTRDFLQGFANSLAACDELILMDIYPARELPITGVSSEVLLEKIPMENKRLVKDEELVETIKGLDVEVLATVGAGDIDRFVLPIKELMEEGSYA